MPVQASPAWLPKLFFGEVVACLVSLRVHSRGMATESGSALLLVSLWRVARGGEAAPQDQQRGTLRDLVIQTSFPSLTMLLAVAAFSLN